jgi:protein-tyrosine kinase
VNAVPNTLAHGALRSGSSRSIGDILVASGRLSTADAARIMERQQADQSHFGDAGIALNILTKEDIDFALSEQFEYSYLNESDSRLSPQLIAAYKPFSKVGENLRAVRSQLMLRWLNGERGRKAIAVVSPGHSEGRSFIAANLAVVFSQQGQRTLLIDGNMRAGENQDQQALFKLEKSAGLSAILAGRTGLEVLQDVQGFPGLGVLPCGATPPNPQELLGRAAFEHLLQTASYKFDVIIIDSPPGSKFADSEIIAARAGAAVLVTRKNVSRLPQAVALTRRLQDNGVAMVGSILNDD